MSVLSIVQGFAKNWAPNQSVLAGGAATVLVYGIGAALVALNVTIPFVGVPLSMAMVTGAAPVIGQVATYLTPDSVKEKEKAFADQLQVSVAHLKAWTPEIQNTYPGDPLKTIQATGPDNGNYNKEG